LSSVRRDQRHKSLLSSILLRLRNAALSAAFDAWVDRAQRMQRCQQMMSRLMDGLIYRAFDGWLSAVRTRARHRTILTRIATRIQNSLVFAA